MGQGSGIPMNESDFEKAKQMLNVKSGMLSEVQSKTEGDHDENLNNRINHENNHHEIKETESLVAHLQAEMKEENEKQEIQDFENATEQRDAMINSLNIENHSIKSVDETHDTKVNAIVKTPITSEKPPIS